MKESGIEAQPEIDCWCGFKASFHHVSGLVRKDGKITIWYKCRNGHRTNVIIPFKSPIEKVIPKKKEKKEKNEKTNALSL